MALASFTYRTITIWLWFCQEEEPNRISNCALHNNAGPVGASLTEVSQMILSRTLTYLQRGPDRSRRHVASWLGLHDRGGESFCLLDQAMAATVRDRLAWIFSTGSTNVAVVESFAFWAFAIGIPAVTATPTPRCVINSRRDTDGLLDCIDPSP